MKLWLLERTDSSPYDQWLGFVVRAETEQQAREIAAEEGNTSWGNEGAVYLDPTKSTCTEIAIDGSAGVILGSFNAG